MGIRQNYEVFDDSFTDHESVKVERRPNEDDNLAEDVVIFHQDGSEIAVSVTMAKNLREVLSRLLEENP